MHNFCWIKPKFHWVVTSRHDTTRHVRHVVPMHFGCVEFVEQHGSTRSSRLARHVERVESYRDVMWRANWHLGWSNTTYLGRRLYPLTFFEKYRHGGLAKKRDSKIELKSTARVRLVQLAIAPVVAARSLRAGIDSDGSRANWVSRYTYYAAGGAGRMVPSSVDLCRPACLYKPERWRRGRVPTGVVDATGLVWRAISRRDAELGRNYIHGRSSDLLLW